MWGTIVVLLIANSTTLVYSAHDNLPTYGGLIHIVGESLLVEGILATQLDCRIDTYVDDNLAQTFVHFSHLVESIKTQGKTFSPHHLRSLQYELHTCKYHIIEAIHHASENFTRIFGHENPELLEKHIEAHMEKIPTAVDRSKYSNDIFWLTLDKVKQGSRTKRSWFDAVGNALKVVIGTATTGDVNRLEEKFRNKSNQLVQSTHQLEAKQNKLQGFIKQSFQQIEHLYSALKTTSNKLNELDHFVIYQNSIQELINIVRYLITLAREHERSITLLNNGILPPMIERKVLNKLIKEGEDRFIQLTFPIPINSRADSNMNTLLSLIQVSGTVHQNVFVLAIPFIDIAKQGKLYSATTFPIRNSIGDLIQPTVEPFLWAGATEHARISSLADCSQITPNKYICHTDHARWSNQVPSCLLALLNNNKMQSHQACKYHPTTLTNGYFVKRWFGSWYILLPKPILANVACPVTRHNNLKPYHGVVVISPPCSFHSEHLTLTTTQLTDTIVDMSAMIIPFGTIEIENVTTPNTSRALADVQQQLDALNLTTLVATPIMDQWLPTAHSMVSYTTAVLATLIVISFPLAIIGCKLYTKRRNTREQTLRNPDGFPMPIRKYSVDTRHTNLLKGYQSTPDMTTV